MVKEFKGEHNWLSNFYPCRIEYKGLVYPSAEHAYMAQKNDSETWKKQCADDSNPPSLIKKMSYMQPLRKDWENVKLGIMKEVLTVKFNKPVFTQRLLKTEGEIQEGNTWGDKFWGVDLVSGEGHNQLGRIIMEIREELRRQFAHVD